MFTYADGRRIRPEYLTHRFRALIKELDLPPIRLHDLRHGAATLALASHTDLKVIQQMLGHSSIVTTADTYTSVLPETAHRAAQATANMVMKAARTIPGARRGGATLPISRPPSLRPATARREFPQFKSLWDRTLRIIARALGHQPRDPGMPHPCPTMTEAV